MDLSKLTETLQATLGGTLPNVLGALGILILGWFVALAVRAGVRKGLGMSETSISDCVPPPVPTWTLKVGQRQDIYYLILLLVLVGIF